MNQLTFKQFQESFLDQYPGGFENERMVAEVKKHNIPKWVNFVKVQLSETALEENPEAVAAITKLITGSSLVSVFEKTAFKNMVNGMSVNEREDLVLAVGDLLYRDQETGFVKLTALLGRYQNAKWPVITTFLYYSNPDQEVLIKPSTVKRVIEKLELKPLKYPTKPDYDFYCAYREAILTMKATAVPELQVENGAFCGFLMYAVDMDSE